MKHRCDVCGLRFQLARLSSTRSLRRSWCRYVGPHVWCAWCVERIGDPAQLELPLERVRVQALQARAVNDSRIVDGLDECGVCRGTGINGERDCEGCGGCGTV